jgi:hypothetical protein
MGLDSKEADLEVIRDEKSEANTVCLHAFSDLTYVSPVVFLYLLKECYKHGKSLLYFFFKFSICFLV